MWLNSINLIYAYFSFQQNSGVWGSSIITPEFLGKGGEGVNSIYMFKKLRHTHINKLTGVCSRPGIESRLHIFRFLPLWFSHTIWYLPICFKRTQLSASRVAKKRDFVWPQNAVEIFMAQACVCPKCFPFKPPCLPLRLLSPSPSCLPSEETWNAQGH